MISIIILNYNTYKLSCECIYSINKYTSEVEYEIILIDNASTECSPDLFKAQFPELVLIKSEQNLGFSKGINLALKFAKGEFILLLNSDTFFTCNVLIECKKLLDESPRIGALTTKIIYPNGKPQPVIHKFPSIKREVFEMLRIHKIFKRNNILLGEFFDYSKFVEGEWIWGTFFFTRKEIIKKLPEEKFPDDFFMYFEDVQWGFSYYDLEYRMAFAPLGDVVHYCSASSDKLELNKKTIKISQNEKIYFTKRYGKIYVAILFIIRAFKYLSIGEISYFKFFIKSFR